MTIRVGILALQGDFQEHQAIYQQLGVATQLVRLPIHLDTVDRLILPGGESTTIGKLLVRYQLLDAIRQRVQHNTLAVWGTCAGAILMAHTLTGTTHPNQPSLDIMNITVRRNAFGRQIDSFEAAIAVPALGDTPVHGVFIRAPAIEAVGDNVTVLAQLPHHDAANTIVLAQQHRLLAATFHPELTTDSRLHRYFLEL